MRKQICFLLKPETVLEGEDVGHGLDHVGVDLGLDEVGDVQGRLVAAHHIHIHHVLVHI